MDKKKAIIGATAALLIGGAAWLVELQKNPNVEVVDDSKTDAGALTRDSIDPVSGCPIPLVKFGELCVPAEHAVP